jgi:hypothetical protein
MSLERIISLAILAYWAYISAVCKRQSNDGEDGDDIDDIIIRRIDLPIKMDAYPQYVPNSTTTNGTLPADDGGVGQWE